MKERDKLQSLLCNELAISFDTVNYSNAMTRFFIAYMLNRRNNSTIEEVKKDFKKDIAEDIENAFSIFFKHIKNVDIESTAIKELEKHFIDESL